jgi:hypothetical protein
MVTNTTISVLLLFARRESLGSHRPLGLTYSMQYPSFVNNYRTDAKSFAEIYAELLTRYGHQKFKEALRATP